MGTAAIGGVLVACAPPGSGGLDEWPGMTTTYGDHMGVSVTLPSKSDVDLARSLGFRWIRGGAECGWGAEVDAQLDVARYAQSVGMRFMWCSLLSSHRMDQSRAGEWVAYHQKVAQAGVRYHEIGNEWNSDAFYSPYDPTWASQALWMQLACNTIKAANPTARVITGGMAPYGNDDGVSNNRWPFLAVARLTKYLDLSKWDAFGNHLHCHPENPQGVDPLHLGWYASSQGNRLFWAAVQRYGKPIYNTEFGSMTSEFANEDARLIHFKQYLAEFYNQWRAGIKMPVSFLHTLRDSSSFIPGQETPTWGIVRADGTDKPPTTDWIRRLLATTWGAPPPL